MASPWHLLLTCAKLSVFFSCIGKAVDIYSNYEHILQTGDFDAEED